MKRTIVCICIAVFFAIGILGNAHPSAPIYRNAEFPQAAGAVHAETELLAVNPLKKMDDFQLEADADGMQLHPAGAARQTVLLFWEALYALLLFGCFFFAGLLRFGEISIPVFRVVTFIHRFDGKKKSCFKSDKRLKNRRLSDWKLELNIKFCRLMKKKKCSVI